jgi:hypothetical protein
MPESPTASAMRIMERDLSRAMQRITSLSDLVAEAAERLEETDANFARELRGRAFDMSFGEWPPPRGVAW